MKRIFILLLLLFIALPVFSEESKILDFTWDAKQQKYIHTSSGEIEFKYDDQDQLIKIGNYEVKYNSSGKIEFIGDMSVKYDSKNRIKQVGDKKIHYLSDGRISSITGKNWSYMRAYYVYFGGQNKLFRIGNYEVEHDINGRIKFLIPSRIKY